MPKFKASRSHQAGGNGAAYSTPNEKYVGEFAVHQGEFPQRTAERMVVPFGSGCIKESGVSSMNSQSSVLAQSIQKPINPRIAKSERALFYAKVIERDKVVVEAIICRHKRRK